jgi:hypothetical protein
MREEQVSITGFFLRFTISYTILMAATGVTLGMLGISHAGNVNAPILAIIAYWFFLSYSKKNQRIMDGPEKWKLIWAAVAGDVFTSILLGTPTMIANGVPIQFLFIGMVFVIPLHLVLLVAVSYGVKRQLMKQRPEWQAE